LRLSAVTLGDPPISASPGTVEATKVMITKAMTRLGMQAATRVCAILMIAPCHFARPRRRGQGGPGLVARSRRRRSPSAARTFYRVTARIHRVWPQHVAPCVSASNDQD
jgi:hypothetical protein